jgi:signal transduction histidine kinase
LKVTVSDNGRGFDIKALADVSSNRLGLQGMRERAAMLRGTVSFTSKGKGTRILVQIPLTGQDVGPSVPRTKF